MSYGTRPVFTGEGGVKISVENRDEPSVSTPRVVIIVARDRPDLQAHFEAAFAGMPEVKVIRDRRIGEGDGPGGPGGARDRRDRYTELRDRGFVVVRIW